MMRNCLLWVAERPVDGVVGVSVLGAIAFAFGGETAGVVTTFGLIGGLIASIAAGRRLAKSMPSLKPGTQQC